MVSRRESTVFKKGRRTLPVLIHARSFCERSRIARPEDFSIDEIPAPVDLKSTFGTYRTRVEKAGEQQLLVERSLELTTAEIPASDYESVRSFYEQMLKAEQAPVVLRRK